MGAAFEVGGILMAKSRAKRRTERLSQQAPEAVLGDHKLNDDIPYSGIRSARMDNPGIVATGTLELESDAGKQASSLTDEDDYQEHTDLLRTALKEKLQFR